MSDEFDLSDLRAALDRAAPRPDPARKAADIALARAAFDRLHQAREVPARPTPGRTGVLSGVRDMLTHLRGRGALAATTALVACGFLVLTPMGRDLLRRPADGMPDRVEGTPEATVAVPEAEATLVPEGETEAEGALPEAVEAEASAEAPAPPAATAQAPAAPTAAAPAEPEPAPPPAAATALAEAAPEPDADAMAGAAAPEVAAAPPAADAAAGEAALAPAAPALRSDGTGQAAEAEEADDADDAEAPAPAIVFGGEAADAAAAPPVLSDELLPGSGDLAVAAPAAPAPEAVAGRAAEAALAAPSDEGEGGLPSGDTALEAETHRDPGVAMQSDGVSAEESARALREGGTFLGVEPDASGLARAPDAETFAPLPPSPLHVTAEDPVSTFSIDVDTASYSLVRQSVLSGARPPPGAVRIEEMVNAFDYDWPAPAAGEGPVRPMLSVIPTPWNPGTRLVAVALRGAEAAVRPPVNLVFLIDTSGSMDEPAKLPLLVQSLRLLSGALREGDEVAVVAYAGSSGLVLPPVPATDRTAILGALGRLSAGGGTNGQGGLEQAYAVAAGMAAPGEVTRVVLATDGDFNVGLADPAGLEAFIARQREGGTSLNVLGFGRGTLDDAAMQALAQAGNGQAAYIDSLAEAQRALVGQLDGALVPVAQDVKVQVEWNPAAVAEWRLIGYETRALAREDFADDRVDAGEMGSGHAVTALYEVTPVGSPARRVEPLRYAAEAAEAPAAVPGTEGELGFLRLRWKEPGGSESRLLEAPIREDAPAQPDVAWAAAVAGWGMLLRGEALGGWGWPELLALAEGARGDDRFGLRAEALSLMRLSAALSP